MGAERSAALLLRASSHLGAAVPEADGTIRHPEVPSPSAAGAGEAAQGHAQRKQITPVRAPAAQTWPLQPGKEPVVLLLSPDPGIFVAEERDQVQRAKLR